MDKERRIRKFAMIVVDCFHKTKKYNFVKIHDIFNIFRLDVLFSCQGWCHIWVIASLDIFTLIEILNLSWILQPLTFLIYIYMQYFYNCLITINKSIVFGKQIYTEDCNIFCRKASSS